MARISQHRRISLFSLWCLDQSDTGKNVEYLFNEKKNNLYDSQRNNDFFQIDLNNVLKNLFYSTYISFEDLDVAI